MKLMIAMFAALVAFGLVIDMARATATEDGCAVVTKTPDGFLNLRKLPMGKADIVLKLRLGDKLWISSATCETQGNLTVCNDEGWTRVEGVRRLDSDLEKKWHTGWAATRYLKFRQCEPDMKIVE